MARFRRRFPDNWQSCCVEESVFTRGNADCSGGFGFLPEKIVVFAGEYNLPLRVARNILLRVLADLGRHGRG